MGPVDVNEHSAVSVTTLEMHIMYLHFPPHKKNKYVNKIDDPSGSTKLRHFWAFQPLAA